MPSNLQRTPLYHRHTRMGARMTAFSGWAMPVQYTGVLEEHQTVRKAAGLFDLSHMGEFRLFGADALQNLQVLMTNDVAHLKPGQAQYTLMCQDDGGIVDDLLVYRIGAQSFLLVVNAATTGKDRAWIESRLDGDVQLTDESQETALLAVQGPAAASVLEAVTDDPVASVPRFEFLQGKVAGRAALISRTGYTGEDGFELYVKADEAEPLWDELLARSEPAGLRPIGLGARDTLRLEARLLLYGQDIDENSTPIEAGLTPFVRLGKGSFIGREALARQQDEGTNKRLIGFEMLGRGVPRTGYPILIDGEIAGTVTSGGYAPSLRKGIGLGYVRGRTLEGDLPLSVQIRGRAHPARRVRGPFIRRGS